MQRRRCVGMWPCAVPGKNEQKFRLGICSGEINRSRFRSSHPRTECKGLRISSNICTDPQEIAFQELHQGTGYVVSISISPTHKWETLALVKALVFNILCRFKVNSHISSCFNISRGVKQGSVLSPTLFLAVMDLLLKRLQESECGLHV